MRGTFKSFFFQRKQGQNYKLCNSLRQQTNAVIRLEKFGFPDSVSSYILLLLNFQKESELAKVNQEIRNIFEFVHVK
jgi:hypothetical protein